MESHHKGRSNQRYKRNIEQTQTQSQYIRK
jgi:hypothetical protein